MPSTTSERPGANGTTILARRWRPSGEAWASVALVHGVGEHSGRYERAGDLLAASGLDVHAFDLPGQGGSSGPRGDIERWDDFVEEAALALELARVEGDGRPTVLFGHSLGGLVALDAALGGSAAPDLLVLSAPALRDGIAGWVHVVAPVAARVAPRVVVRNTWDGSYLSRDPEVGRASEDDPLCVTGATLRLAAAGFGAQARVRADVEGRSDLPVPTYVFHGGDDRLVPPGASAPLGRLANVTRRAYPGLRHETLNEPEGPRVVAEMVAWLREQV